MSAAEKDLLVFEDVSKFYGEVLGVDRVTLAIPPGITGLVGPNGSGKTTLMNLATGLIRPTRGRIRVLGVAPDDPERLFALCGYCTGFEAFPAGVTGRSFLEGVLSLRGGSREETRALATRSAGHATPPHTRSATCPGASTPSTTRCHAGAPAA